MTQPIKKCSVCGESKPLDQFPHDRSRKLYGGLYPRCSACRRSRYFMNRESELQRMREYRQRNREKLNQRQKDYIRKRFFYVRSRNLGIRHPNESVASPKELAQLWKKQRAICPFSGIRLNKHSAQLDHIIPLIKGGSGTIENLRWVHRDVNYAKRDLSDTQFVALCRLVAARNSQ